MRVGDDLGQHRHQSAKKVEGHVPQGIHGVFNLRPKGPQEDHVADDVRPTTMNEHGGKQSDPMMAAHNVGRDCGPVEHKRFAA